MSGEVQIGIQIYASGTEATKTAISGITQGVKNLGNTARESRSAVANLSDGWKKLLDQGARQFNGTMLMKQLATATQGAVLPAEKLAERWAKLHEIGSKRLQAIEWANQLAVASAKAETNVQKLTRQWGALSEVGAKRLQAIEWANQLAVASAKAETAVEKLARQWGALSNVGAKRFQASEWANKLSTASASTTSTTQTTAVPNISADVANQTKGMGDMALAAIRATVAIVSLQAALSAFKKLIATADEYNNLVARVKLVSGTMQEQETAMRGVFDIAQETRSPLREMTQLYYRLATSATANNMTQQDVLRVTELVGKSLKVSGASATENAAALQQFSQAMQAGVLNGDEFRSVMENMPRVAKALTDSLKVNIATLREMSSQGKLTTAVITTALKEQGDAIDKDFSRMPLTVAQAIVQLQNAAEKFVGQSSGATEASRELASAIHDIAINFDKLAKIVTVPVEALRGWQYMISAIAERYKEVERATKGLSNAEAPANLQSNPADAARVRQSMTGDVTAISKDEWEARRAMNKSFFEDQAKDAIKAQLALKGYNEEQQKVALMVYDEANRQGVSTALALSVAETESHFNAMAKSAKGALGVMQLMPPVAEKLNANTGKVEDNIKGGVALLKELGTNFKNDIPLMAAGYNAGEPAVKKYGNTIPPFQETKDYVAKVTAAYIDWSKAQGVANAQLETTDQMVKRQAADFRLLSGAQQESIAKAEADASIASSVNKVKMDALQAEIRAIQDKAKLDTNAAQTKDEDNRIAIAAMDAIKAKMEEATGIAQAQIGIEESLLQKRIAALRVELQHADTADHESAIKQQLLQLEGQLAQKASDRAAIQLGAAGQIRDLDNAELERKAKEQEFIRKINDDLKFQEDLYNRISAAQQAGASDSQLKLMMSQASDTRTLPQNIGSADISVYNEKIQKTEELKQKTNDLVGATNKVEETQLRLNQAWDQSVQRMNDFAAIWERVLGVQSKGFNGISKSLANYTKQLNQIDRDKKQSLKDATSESEKEQARSAATYDTYMASFAALADITDQMKTMFAVGSTGYKEMEALSKTAALASQAVAIAKAVEAVMAALAEGDPYTAIPRALAVAAMAISFLSNIGATISGGGGNQVTGKDYAKSQLNQMNASNATTLGSTDASNSILDALDIIAKNSTANLDYSRGMAHSLEIISNALAGAGAAVAQGFNFSTANMHIGEKSKSINSFGNAISIGDPLTNLLNDMFWGTTKITREVAGQGIEIFNQSLRKVLEDGLLKGREYTDVLVTKKTTALFGMISKSSQHIETEYQKLQKPIVKAFTDTFASIGDTLKLAAKNIGINSDLFESQLNAMVIKMGRIQLGDSGKENAKRITAAFSAQADRWSALLFPQFKAFQQLGEGMFQTVVRMTAAISTSAGELSQIGVKAAGISSLSDVQRRASDVEAELVRNSLMAATTLADVNGVLKDMAGTGSDMIAAFKDLLSVRAGMEVMGLAAINVSQDMILAAGGISNLRSSIQSFIQNFMTPNDSTAAKWKDLADQFTLLGLKMPKTKAEFVTLINSIDRTTIGGQKLWGAVMSLNGAFSDAVGTINASVDAVQTAYDRQKQLAKSLRDYVLGLSVNNASLSPEAKYNAAKKLYEDTLAKAKAGDETAQANLQSVAQAFLDASRAYNASGAGFAADLQSVTTGLDSVATSIDSTLSAAKDQVAALQDNTSAVLSLTDAIAQYNATSTNNTSNVSDIINTQNNTPGVVDVTTANSNNSAANNALVAQRAREAKAAEYNNKFLDLVNSLKFAKPAEAKKLKADIAALIAEVTSSPFNLAVTQVGGTKTASYLDNVYSVSLRAKGGYTPKGFTIVGEQGPELVNFDKPSQILNAKDTSKALHGDPKMVELLSGIMDEIKALVTTQSSANPLMIEKLSIMEARLTKMERIAKIIPA
jgi:tape measure domain-containing protein